MKQDEPNKLEQLRILAWPYRTSEKSNPYQRLLYDGMAEAGDIVEQFSAQRVLTGEWDVCHIHWPESILATVLAKPLPQALVKIVKTWLSLKLVRHKRIRIVWTAHNLKPHSSVHPKLSIFWMRLFVGNIDGILCLSESGKQQLLETYPVAAKIPVYVVPHGHYRGWYPDTVLKHEAMSSLGVSEANHLVLFLGLIRPYKNVPKLIQCFVDNELPNWVLIVAGRAEEKALINELVRSSKGSERVRIELDFVKNEDVQVYFRAAELFVVPYTDILNSGSAILSLSFDCPVLVPNKGAMKDLQTLVGSDWVMTYDGDLTPVILREALSWAVDGERSSRAPLDDLDWSSIGQLTSDAFHEILGQ